MTHPLPGRVRRVLVVDDHPVVRLGLSEMLESEPDLEVCGQAESAAEAIALVDANDPDLVLIDISLRGSNGIELIKQLKARAPEVKMLVSSMHDEKLFAERALRAGAMGYISKDAAVPSLVDAVRQVLVGKIYLSAEMTERLLQHHLTGTAAAEGGSSIESLSDRELEVFGLIGEGYSTREIAERLHLSVKTIESHREHIKAKLGLETNNELIRRAVEWVLRSSTPPDR